MRNLLRFPMLAILLGYATMPLVSGDAHRFGPMIRTLPGPWAGFVGAAGCVAALAVYSLWPYARRRPQPVFLGNLHFYLTAFACMGLFFGLFRAGSDSMFVTDPELVTRFSSYVRVRSLAGWLLCATAALPVLGVILMRRAGPAPSATTDEPASPPAKA